MSLINFGMCIKSSSSRKPQLFLKWIFLHIKKTVYTNIFCFCSSIESKTLWIFDIIVYCRGKEMIFRLICMHRVGTKSIAMRRFAFLSSSFHWNSTRESVTRNLPIAGPRRQSVWWQKIEELRNAFKMLKWSAIYIWVHLRSARRSETSCAHTTAGLSVCGQNRPQDSNRVVTMTSVLFSKQWNALMPSNDTKICLASLKESIIVYYLLYY